MKLLSIQAQNYKGFKDLNVDFSGKSTVIFGANGVGKTGLLSIINYLSWNWLSRLNPMQSTAFKSLNADLVRFGSSRMEMAYTLAFGQEEMILKKAYTKSKPGKGTVIESNKKLYDAFLNEFMSRYGAQDKDLPLLVNYGTNRSVLDVPLRIRKKHQFSKWTSLERAVENELDFKTFFEWFRNQEDYESEIIREKKDFDYNDPSLCCVRKAIESVMPEFNHLRIKRNPLRMTVEKDGMELRMDQLSDGEKCTLALFGDLARRLALANPNRENALTGEGIVLIDEIELHLHPSWQRKILHVLKKTFPNIQFIVTTHSPQVLGEADDEMNVFYLDRNERHEGIIRRMGRMDAFDSNLILEDYMNTGSKSAEFTAQVDMAKRYIRDHDFEKAEKQIQKIIETYDPNLADVVMLEGYLKRSKIVDEKNHKAR